MRSAKKQSLLGVKHGSLKLHPVVTERASDKLAAGIQRGLGKLRFRDKGNIGESSYAVLPLRFFTKRWSSINFIGQSRERGETLQR